GSFPKRLGSGNAVGLSCPGLVKKSPNDPLGDPAQISPDRGQGEHAATALWHCPLGPVRSPSQACATRRKGTSPRTSNPRATVAKSCDARRTALAGRITQHVLDGKTTGSHLVGAAAGTRVFSACGRCCFSGAHCTVVAGPG